MDRNPFAGSRDNAPGDDGMHSDQLGFGESVREGVGRIFQIA
jgi:hypothetical protein